MANPTAPTAPTAPKAPTEAKVTGYKAVNDIYTMIGKKRVTIKGGDVIPSEMGADSLKNLVDKNLAVKISKD